jgi:NTE family protein
MADISVDSFTKHPEVLECIKQLEDKFGGGGKNLVISDVVDGDGHQYVNLVQKGGGVLGVALVGYTYILEQMNIRFIRLAGTSAGAINTSLMTIIGARRGDLNGKQATVVNGNKKIAKSEKILEILCKLNFFDLVDGHPVARFIIQRFITHKNFNERLSKWMMGIVVTLITLVCLDFICLGLQHQIAVVSFFTKFFFVITGFFIMLLTIVLFYLNYLIHRLKDAGFGINPGDYFYDWIKKNMMENSVHTVSDLISVASTPVSDLSIRGQRAETVEDLSGDVTFITSEIVTQNKIEFPKMWNLFKKDKDELHPAGFVRASMAIPIFFESYFINNIPCREKEIKDAWQLLGESDPPSTARFVDGGILSNFPINLFYNPNVAEPRLPSFGIDLDDERDPKQFFAADIKPEVESEKDNLGKDANKWSIGGYLYRMFNTVRFYYDKDFLIKNQFFKKGIGTVPLEGYGWLNFFLKDNEKIEMFVLGAKAATKFLLEFDWDDYKKEGVKLRTNLKGEPLPNPVENK